ncbi:MAG: hypothetical protein RMJ00_06255 [Nitrososphaerota archaeon]|nr:hypothetical protein [Nitrososphaerota archaeon]
MKTRALKIVAVAINASLYAALGYFTYFGIFVGGVRFWPAVVVPGVFSYIFGGMIGGLGAAIGIFVSDVIIHGDPFLSLTVGVPANFLGFYVIGKLASSRSRSGILLGIVAFPAALSILIVSLYIYGLTDSLSSIIGVTLSLSCPITYFLASKHLRGWENYILAAIAGLGVGSLIIGLGVWGYSQLFVMPRILGIEAPLPLYMSIVIAAWTFLSEIPFLIFLVPPIVKAIRGVFPWLGGVDETIPRG